MFPFVLWLPDNIADPMFRTRVLTSHMSPLTVLNLNSVLLESPSTLTENYAQQTTSIICQGIRNKNVSQPSNDYQQRLIDL